MATGRSSPSPSTKSPQSSGQCFDSKRPPPPIMKALKRLTCVQRSRHRQLGASCRSMVAKFELCKLPRWAARASNNAFRCWRVSNIQRKRLYPFLNTGEINLLNVTPHRPSLLRENISRTRASNRRSVKDVWMRHNLFPPLTCSPLSRSQPRDSRPAELSAKNSPGDSAKGGYVQTASFQYYRIYIRTIYQHFTHAN